jgi:MFS family permease
MVLNAIALNARRDARVISVVGLAHGLSHFYALSLPVLFVFIKDDLGVTFTELGLVVTVFYATSGICQTLAGFATDRFGGSRMLFTGLGLFALAYLLMGMAPNYATLVGCAVISGLGNSVFHPADFSILNSAVHPKRLGYAFSVHGFTGNIGFMMAPVVMGPLARVFGWHGALTIGGLAAVAALVFVLAQRDCLAPVEHHEHAAPHAALPPGARVLVSTPVLMCFGFFVLLAAGIVGIQTFGSATLTTAFHFSRETALSTLTGFLAGGTVGIVAGGWAAARTERHEVVAGSGMAGACALIALTASGVLPVAGVAVALALAGFLSGIAQPSRDMVIRKTAPKGSTGKVYGFVYSGLDAGSSTAPLFGYLLDHHHGDVVMYCVAAFWGLAMFTIVTVRRAPAGLPKPA